MFKTVLLITTYNSPQALRCVFDSVMSQTMMPDEVVIADDGSTDSTKEVIDAFRRCYGGTVRHVWHADEGFRKTVILNKAVAATKADYIMEVDGDIILDPHFVADQVANASQGVFVCGMRAYLPENVTSAMLGGDMSLFAGVRTPGLGRRICARRIPWLSPLFRSRHSRSTRQCMGSHMAYWRSDFIRVNGYDEDIIGWGTEDREFARRLLNAGVRRRTLRFAAIEYHLWHKVNSNPIDTERNNRIFREAVESGRVWADNGVDKYL